MIVAYAIEEDNSGKASKKDNSGKARALIEEAMGRGAGKGELFT